MARPTRNESWIIDEGDRIIEKKADTGASSLTSWEQLVYCLWVADYGMRNAGDLETAFDVNGEFKSNGQRLAKELTLPVTLELFSFDVKAFESLYFNHFEAVCKEIKRAKPKG